MAGVRVTTGGFSDFCIDRIHCNLRWVKGNRRLSTEVTEGEGEGTEEETGEEWGFGVK